jgi:hypothetical protein
MELLYVTVISAGIGAILHFLLPGARASHGVLLLPAVAAAVTSTLWVGLVWLGWRFDGGWIWVVSLVAGGLVAILSSLLLGRFRRERDAQLLHRLSGGKA